MQMNELAAAPGAASPEVFQRLGLITRQLHDTLKELGVMSKLQQSAEGLSDARTRLSYIAKKTGEAADKVLTSVELAKQEHAAITVAARRITTTLAAGSSQVTEAASVMAFVGEVEAATSRIDNHLTDIMLAQDFHDLTGQVIAKVVTLAIDLEESLIKLLVHAAPAELAGAVEHEVLAGPVADPTGRTDVVSNQGEVDDLLASLGF